MSNYMERVRSGLIAQGIPAYGKMHLLSKAPTSYPALEFGQYFDPDKQYTSLATAEAGLTDLRKDTLLVTEESHALAAAFTWDLNETNLVGMSPSGLAFNKRARVGMSTAFTPMITVSGYGNHFANLYTMHGTAAGDYVGWYISGARNVFDGIHFGGPMVAAQGGHASYNGVHVLGSECVFRNCVFGTNTIERDELTPNVTLGAETITVFDNCIFTCALTDTDPYFIKVANTAGYTQAYFNNCKFLAFSANQANKAAVVFTFTAGYSADMVLDPLCTFAGVTHLAVTGSMKYIWAPTVFAATADELNLIAINSATF